MVYLRLKENSSQAKAFLEYIKTIPFIEIIDKNEIPNETTCNAIAEADQGNLKRFKSTKALMKDLKS
jgi:hypothetical protein